MNTQAHLKLITAIALITGGTGGVLFDLDMNKKLREKECKYYAHALSQTDTHIVSCSIISELNLKCVCINSSILSATTLTKYRWCCLCCVTCLSCSCNWWRLQYHLCPCFSFLPPLAIDMNGCTCSLACSLFHSLHPALRIILIVIEFLTLHGQLVNLSLQPAPPNHLSTWTTSTTLWIGITWPSHWKAEDKKCNFKFGQVTFFTNDSKFCVTKVWPNIVCSTDGTLPKSSNLNAAIGLGQLVAIVIDTQGPLNAR